MKQKDVKKFEKWLVMRGCEILPPTNSYEILRFKGREVGVLYSSGKTSGKYADGALKAFYRNSRWAGKPIKTGRKNSYKAEKRKLIARDGTDCFFCGLALEDDITLEHLIPLVRGGKNSLENMVLAHEACNQEAELLPIYQKVEMAISKRILISPFQDLKAIAPPKLRQKYMDLRRERAKMLREKGYSIREIMWIMGYKSPKSIQDLIK